MLSRDVELQPQSFVDRRYIGGAHADLLLHEVGRRAFIEGLQAGCIEALMLNTKGEIAECTGDNIFLVRDGVLYTPPLDAGILEGVTRDAVIDLAGETNREVRESALTKHDVYVAEECFLTGTAAEVIPVVKVDGRKIGTGVPGPVTRDLRKRFHQLTQS